MSRLHLLLTKGQMLWRRPFEEEWHPKRFFFFFARKKGRIKVWLQRASPVKDARRPPGGYGAEGRLHDYVYQRDNDKKIMTCSVLWLLLSVCVFVCISEHALTSSAVARNREWEKGGKPTRYKVLKTISVFLKESCKKQSHLHQYTMLHIIRL